MLFLDGAYVERPDGTLRCCWVKAPTSAEFARLTQALTLRIGRGLVRQGRLEWENEIDNRGSHFYLAMYWAEAVAAQDQGPSLKEKLQNLADTLHANEDGINGELPAARGSPIDVGGYYSPDPVLATRAMRPSKEFNDALEALKS